MKARELIYFARAWDLTDEEWDDICDEREETALQQEPVYDEDEEEAYSHTTITQRDDRGA